MTIYLKIPPPLTPKPLPPVGTLRDLAEAILWSFQQWTPEQQAEFRAETMRRVRADLARLKWDEEHPDRPYEDERKN